MAEKPLTNLTLTDLFEEYKGMWNYCQEHDEAVKRFRIRHIEIALEEERRELICCLSYERSPERRDYKAWYWKR